MQTTVKTERNKKMPEEKESSGGAVFSCDLKLASTPLPHFWEHTVGSAHAALALRKDWQEQLTRCKKELGFKHVRFHGILSDDMYTLAYKDEKKEGEPIYSFFNIDQIFDFLLSIDIRPFIELSFMPTAISSGTDTVFSYKGNIDPPKDYNAWATLISKLLNHLIERYGMDEVRKWYFEVWNEPNLESFWKGKQEDYFKLYQCTAKAIKNVDKDLKVGGPATAKNEWITEFISFCEKNEVPCDFISTHHYPADAFDKEKSSSVDKLAKIERNALQEQEKKVKDQISNKPLYYTEWSSSSDQYDELHDQPYTAAFVIKTIFEANGLVDGFSYWTFSDIFAENHLSSIPFHGGFGLLNIYNVPKAAYRAFEMLHNLGNELFNKEGSHPTVDTWVIQKQDCINVVITNWAQPKHDIKTESVKITLKNINLPQSIFIERIDDDHANPFKVWNEMGKPESLKADQVSKLELSSQLKKESLNGKFENNTLLLEVTVPPQGIVNITVQLSSATPSVTRPNDKTMLGILQKESFEYFLNEVNEQNGLVKDNTSEDSAASISSVGMGLSCYVVAVKNGFISRTDGIRKTLNTLRFLKNSHQGPEPDATGYKGFYYHFLDMNTGKRINESELSTIDTAILLSGILLAANFYLEDTPEEKEIRNLANDLYSRVDWKWSLNGGETITHGWKPESGFLPNRWDEGYSEAQLLYILALGSSTFPIEATGYKKWLNTFEWKKIYGIEYFHAGPLFIHQMSQVWLDLKDIHDDLNKKSGIDYFENSRRATFIQQKYAIENPLGYFHYNENCWGLTASNGPGPCKLKVNGIEREFYNYTARGVPNGPDDGTISPWATVASLPFAPDLVLSAIRYAIEILNLKQYSKYGFDASFNPTFPETGVNPYGWISSKQYALNQGPIILMIENYTSRLVWDTMKKSSYIINGLKKAGFKEGWLDNIK